MVTNQHLVASVDTDQADIGIDYSEDVDYKESLKGKTIATDWYYDKLDEIVIAVVTPLYVHDKVMGVVMIGISQKLLKADSLSLVMLIFFATMLISVGYL